MKKYDREYFPYWLLWKALFRPKLYAEYRKAQNKGSEKQKPEQDDKEFESKIEDHPFS